MALVFTANYIEDALGLFRFYRSLAEKAMAQLSDDEFFRTPGPEDNSIALLVKHLGENFRSRWTDFLLTDGEKPSRDRDGEFELRSSDIRPALMAAWEEGWSELLNTLSSLTESDLGHAVTIRGEPHSVLQAIGRSLTHCAYHTGQIVLLAKLWKGTAWQTLSVPRGRSAEFTRRVRDGELSQR